MILAPVKSFAGESGQIHRGSQELVEEVKINFDSDHKGIFEQEDEENLVAAELNSPLDELSQIEGIARQQDSRNQQISSVLLKGATSLQDMSQMTSLASPTRIVVGHSSKMAVPLGHTNSAKRLVK